MTKFKTFLPSSESNKSDYFYAFFLNFNFYNDNEKGWYYQVTTNDNIDDEFPYIVQEEFTFYTKEGAFEAANKWLHDQLNKLIEE